METLDHCRSGGHSRHRRGPRHDYHPLRAVRHTAIALLCTIAASLRALKITRDISAGKDVFNPLSISRLSDQWPLPPPWRQLTSCCRGDW
jgi:hypothetical protein